MTTGLLERIEAHARQSPDRIAHVSGDRTLTYGDLVTRADTLARGLDAELGADRSPIAVVGHKEPELLIAFLAVVMSGRPYVPIDVSLPPARIERIIASSGARLVLTPEAIAARLAEASRVSSEHPVLLRVSAGDPFYVIYTSGSTGEPKGVTITLRSLEAFVDWMLAEQRFAEGEVFLDQAPFSFDLSVMDLYPALASGGTLFSITKEDVANPVSMFATLARSGIVTWVSTPSFAQMCLSDRRFDASLLPNVRRFLFCGETLPPDVASRLLQRFPRAEVWNTYGPTEATVATTSIRIDAAALARWTPLPVGYVMPGTIIAILSEGDAPVPDGERGEIVIAGPNVSAGYLGRPDLDARAFTQVEGMRAYRTGDFGSVRDGVLFFDGRRDAQVKVAGFRIELGDVEANLCALVGVRDAVVVKDDKRELLVAYVIRDSSEASDARDARDAQALRTALAARVPAYMVPARIRFVDAFPMTANGKRDVPALVRGEDVT